MQAEAGAPLSAEPGPDHPPHDGEGSPDPAAPPASAATQRAARVSVPMVTLLVGLAVLGLALDQLSKAWVVSSLTTGVPKPLLGDLLRLNRTSNPGAAFSIATNATWVLTLIACAVIIGTLYVARRLRSRGWACALGLLIGGALGNLTDRFLRPPGGGKGHVVDFIELPHWPIFNVADMCIVTAAVLICLLAFLGIGVDGSRAARDDAAAEHTDTDQDGRA